MSEDVEASKITSAAYIPRDTIPIIKEVKDYPGAYYDGKNKIIGIEKNPLATILNSSLIGVADGRVDLDPESASKLLESIKKKGIIPAGFENTLVSTPVKKDVLETRIYLPYEVAERLVRDKTFKPLLMFKDPAVYFMVDSRGVRRYEEKWAGGYVSERKNWTSGLIRKLSLEIIKNIDANDFEGERKRSEIHESMHYLDCEIRSRGMGTRLLKAVEEIKKEYDDKIEKEDIRNKVEIILRQTEEAVSLMEAEAQMHEILGSRILGESHKFSVSNLACRLTSLISNYRKTSQGVSILERSFGDFIFLDSKPGLLDSHDMATLVLLFGERIVSEERGKVFDFRKLLSSEQREKGRDGQMRIICGVILDRIEEVISNPKEFAKQIEDISLKNLIVEKLTETRTEILGNLRYLVASTPELKSKINL